MIYYAISYVILKYNYKLLFSKLMIILIIMYIVYYLFLDTSRWIIEAPGLLTYEGCFKLIYYFSIMLIGLWFRIIYKEKNSDNYMKFIISSILSIITLYGTKILMQKFELVMHIQFINQLCVIWFIISIFRLGLSYEETLVNHAHKDPRSFKIVKFLSDITLEIYLVQFIIIDYSALFKFPVNVIIALILIAIFAKTLNIIGKMIFYKLR